VSFLRLFGSSCWPFGAARRDIKGTCDLLRDSAARHHARDALVCVPRIILYLNPTLVLLSMGMLLNAARARQ